MSMSNYGYLDNSEDTSLPSHLKTRNHASGYKHRTVTPIDYGHRHTTELAKQRQQKSQYYDHNDDWNQSGCGGCNVVQKIFSDFIDDGYRPNQSIVLPLASSKIGYIQSTPNPANRSFTVTKLNQWFAIAIAPNNANPNWRTDAGFLPNTKVGDVWAASGLGTFNGNDEFYVNRWWFVTSLNDAVNMRIILYPLSLLPFLPYQPPVVPEGNFPIMQIHEGPYRRLYYIDDLIVGDFCAWHLLATKMKDWSFYSPVTVSCHKPC